MPATRQDRARRAGAASGERRVAGRGADGAGGLERFRRGAARAGEHDGDEDAHARTIPNMIPRDEATLRVGDG